MLLGRPAPGPAPSRRHGLPALTPPASLQVEKIRKLKAMCNERGVNPWIEVDGGVTPDNAWKVIEAGANAIVSGSGVFGAKDYAEAIKGIKNSKRPATVAA